MSNDIETNKNLQAMSYSKKELDKIINFVWALPENYFWAIICKRLIATFIVGLRVE